MSSIWKWLLGIDRSPGEVAPGGSTRLELSALPDGSAALAILLAAVALSALLWQLYRRERRDLSQSRRTLLVGLRLLVLVAVAVMLIEPVLVTIRRETVPSHLPVIIDDSESMRFADPYTDETKAAAVAAALQLQSEGGKSPVDRLRETPRLDLVKASLRPNLAKLGRGRELFISDLESGAKSGTASPSRGRKLDDLKPNRGVSPLGDALRDVLASHRGRPVAGIVLVTDGRSNAGEDPLKAVEAAIRQGIPVFPIAAGAEEGPRNVRLAEVEASPVVFARDPMTLGVVIEARGLKDAEGTVTLEQRVNGNDWEPVGDQRIALGEDGALKRTTFRITPKVVGQYEFRARVGDAGPELTMEDNVATAPVRVVRQQIRILLIAGSPSAEFQFLRNALQRDQHVESGIWLQHADPGYKQGGDRPIQRLPSDAAELGRYDALLLVDPDMRALGTQWPEMIMNFVGKEGGGLIFVPGELYSQQLFETDDAESEGGKWTRLLPVVREPGLFQTEAQVRLSTQTTYLLELTPEGRGDPIFEFNPDPIRNRTILTSLPGMYWSFPVTRARPGATVLARHGDPRMQNQYGRHVLLASQLYGPGRTVFIGFDSTYRWRYLSEDYFDGFWARLVDRVGRNKALGGRFPFQVHLGKSAYRVGDQVSVGVRFTEAAAVAEASGLAAELEVGDQPAEPIHFERAVDDAELLTATFPAEKAGSYSLKITPATGAEEGSSVRVSTTTFRVEPPRREIDEPSLNRPLLADLARLTKGKVFDLPTIGKLDDAIAMREVTRTLEDREELWDAPLLYATIVLGLTSEWVLRKTIPDGLSSRSDPMGLGSDAPLFFLSRQRTVTTATDNTSLGSLREEQALLRSRLARLRRRLQLQMALEFALDAAAALVATAAVLVFLDWWFRLGLPARLVLLAAVLIGVIPFAFLRAVRGWRASRLDDLSLAVTLDRFRPGTGGRVADVLQLPDQLGESEESVSPAMIRLAVRQASEALAASDWASLWNRGRTAKRSTALIAALLVPTLFAVLAPQAARLSVARWLQGSSERWPQRTYLTVSGLGDRNRLLAPRDEPFALEVRADLASVEPKKGTWIVRGRGERLVLRKLPKAPEVPKAVRVRERAAKGAVRDAVMVATGPALFRYELPPSSTSTTFDLTGGDDWLGPVKVDRVDRPSLVGTKLRVKEPGSPGNEFRTIEESAQHPVFLPDTEVELTLVGSEPLSDARLTVHPGQPPKLTRVDASTFTARWTLREAITLEVQLTSRATGLTSKPTFYSIGLLKDREPRVALRALGVGAHVTPVATIPLSLNATDDLGLSVVRLQLERTTTAGDKAEPKTTKKTVLLPLATDGARAVLDHQARHDVELQADPPALGTVLRFVAEAEDKCARGAQVGRSGALQLQVVPSDELFYEILIRQRAERAKFVTLYEAAEKRATSLSRTPTPDDYATAMRGLNAGSRQLDLIAGRIADTLQEMKLNQVGSPKSHRLLQEGVIDPIRALNAGTVNELRGVLQSLTGTAPKAGANAESARRLHGEVVAGMKTILDQMSQWESFVDVVNQVAEVIKMQQNVLQAAEKARESRTQEVFDEKP